MTTEFEDDTSKEDFILAWPGGYEEDFRFYPSDTESKVAKAISQFANPDGICIEIGPGRGLWTQRYLVPSFQKVVCIDVIHRPSGLESDRIEWKEVGSKDYSCSGVATASMDFAFSFGVFCHLSQVACQAYLDSLFRVLKPGSSALLMFGNWSRHPSIKQDPSLRRFANERQYPGTCWFYCDLDMAKEMVINSGFVDFVDVYPDFRDTLCTFHKPL